MLEELTIENFGPLKSVKLNLGKMTIFIGEQATGKSTIAKILSICRYFSYIVNFAVEKQDKLQKNTQFKDGLSDWGLVEYLKPDSVIYYECSLYSFEFRNFLNDKGNDNVLTSLKSNSEQFTSLLDQLKDLRKDEVENENNLLDFSAWYPNENFFRLNVKKVMNNPFFIPAERGFQTLSMHNNSLLPSAILDELTKLNRIAKGFNTDVHIKPLNLTFRNENGFSKVKKLEEDDFHLLHTGASGFQSTIPIVLAVKFNNNQKINKGRTIIVEEPELNLYTKTQKKLIEFFVETINSNNNQFILQTHSPYVLTTLENLMYAFKLGNQKEGKYKSKVSNIIDEKLWLNPNEVNVYYLENGEAKSAIERNEALINKSKIDDVSEVINEVFDKLLTIDLKLQNDL